MKDCKVEGFLEGTEDIYYSNRISRLESVESSRRYMAGLGLGESSQWKIQVMILIRY